MIRGVALAAAAIVAASALAGCMRSARDDGSVELHRREGLREEIAMLHSEVKQWRLDGGMRHRPPDVLVRSTKNSPIHSLKACPVIPDPKDECNDICNIADAICDNAESICRIADDLGDDTWADDKCSEAKASCKEAKDRCCECEGD